ncbi:MAG: hypothetical protein WBA22_12665 [Candidatus Methanofastidiosia archaeon]
MLPEMRTSRDEDSTAELAELLSEEENALLESVSEWYDNNEESEDLPEDLMKPLIEIIETKFLDLYNLISGRLHAVRGDIKNPQSLNLYSYCLNNPVRYHDPFGFNGKSPEEVVEGIFNYLNNLGESMGLSVEEYFTDAEGNPLSIIEGLEKLVKDLGFEIVGDIVKDKEWLTLTDDHSEWVDVLRMTIQFESTTVEIVMYDDKYMGKEGPYGYAPPGTNEIIMNVGKHDTVAELAATLCHEMCHRVLNVTHEHLDTAEQHKYIYPVHMKYITDERYSGHFSDKYTEDHDTMSQYEESRSNDTQDGMCLGSLILGIFVFIGFFFAKTLRGDSSS